MTTSAPGEGQLSPLDQVRLAEADITRRVALVREEREQILKNARERARLVLDEAQKDARREGQGRYREIVADAEEEARAVLAEADQRAKELRRKGSRHTCFAVRQVVSIIAGVEEGELDL